MGGAAWLSIFGLGKASTRKHIHSDLRPRSNATEDKKRRHPQGQSTSRRLAALLAPYRPMRVCASLAPCQPPQIALARSPPIYEMASRHLTGKYCCDGLFDQKWDQRN
jgi:hypothetical protein